MHSASRVMPNGPGSGVAIAANANDRKTTIRHQLSSRRALTTPVKFSISRTSGNSNATPNIRIMLVTKPT